MKRFTIIIIMFLFCSLIIAQDASTFKWEIEENGNLDAVGESYESRFYEEAMAFVYGNDEYKVSELNRDVVNDYVENFNKLSFIEDNEPPLSTESTKEAITKKRNQVKDILSKDLQGYLSSVAYNEESIKNIIKQIQEIQKNTKTPLELHVDILTQNFKIVNPALPSKPLLSIPSNYDVKQTEEGIEIVKTTREDEGFIKSNLIINGKEFFNIKEGSIKLNNENEISFAEFTTDDVTSSYEFKYNDKTYKIRADANSKIRFDPENKKIIAENAHITHQKSIFEGENIEITLKEDGEIKKVDLSKNAIVTDENQNEYSSESEFSVTYDEKTYKESQGNTIYIPKNRDEPILLRGEINYKKVNEFGTENEFYYTGLNENTETELDQTRNHINVLSGDATFGNEKHGVLIKDGESKFIALNLDSEEEAASFSFSYFDEKAQALLKGVVDETTRKFNLYLTDGNEERWITGSHFDKLYQIKEPKEKLQDIITQKSSELLTLVENGEITKEEYASRLTEIQKIQNVLSTSEKDFDTAIQGTENIIKELDRLNLNQETYNELRNDAMLGLADLYKQKISETENLLIGEKNNLNEQIYGIYESLTTQAKETKNLELYTQAALGLADYKRSIYPESSIKEYNNLIDYITFNGFTDENQANYLSSALEQRGLANLEAGNTFNGIKDLKESVTTNPQNIYARELLKETQKDILRTIDAKLYAEINQLDDIVLENKLHLTRDLGLGLTNDEIVDLYERKSKELFNQRSIISSASQFMQRGDLITYQGLKTAQEKQRYIADTYGLTFAQGDPSYEQDRKKVTQTYIDLEKLSSLNHDTKILFNKQNSFEALSFTTGEKYVNLEQLESLSDDILSQVNLVNVLAFAALPSAGTYTIKGGATVLSKVPGGVRLMEGISTGYEALAARVGGARAAQYVTTSFPKTTAAGKFIGEEVIESGIGIAAQTATGSSWIGQGVEIIVGSRNPLDIVEQQSTKTARRTFERSLNYDGEITMLKREIPLARGKTKIESIVGIKFNDKEDLERYLNALQKELPQGSFGAASINEIRIRTGIPNPRNIEIDDFSYLDDGLETHIYQMPDESKIALYTVGKNGEAPRLMRRLGIYKEGTIAESFDAAGKNAATQQEKYANAVLSDTTIKQPVDLYETGVVRPTRDAFEQQTIGSLQSNGISFNNQGVQRRVYTLNPKEANLDLVPEQIRPLIGEDPVAIKYFRELGGGSVGAKYDDAVLEARLRGPINEQLRSQGIDYDFAPQIKTSLIENEGGYARGYTVEAYVPEQQADKVIKTLSNANNQERAVKIANQINEEADRVKPLLEQALQKENVAWTDTGNPENFAIGFRDNTGASVSLSEVLAGKEATPYIRAYEMLLKKRSANEAVLGYKGATGLTGIKIQIENGIVAQPALF